MSTSTKYLITQARNPDEYGDDAIVGIVVDEALTAMILLQQETYARVGKVGGRTPYAITIHDRPSVFILHEDEIERVTTALGCDIEELEEDGWYPVEIEGAQLDWANAGYWMTLLHEDGVSFEFAPKHISGCWPTGRIRASDITAKKEA